MRIRIAGSGTYLQPPNLNRGNFMRIEVQEERERCAKLLELSPSQIRLIAGELTAQEMRTVLAVLENRAQAIRRPDSVVKV